MPTTSPVRVSASSPTHPRDAEVGELRDARAVVRPSGTMTLPRLDVAVDDAAAVGVRERVAQRDADPQHVAVGQRALLA